MLPSCCFNLAVPKTGHLKYKAHCSWARWGVWVAGARRIIVEQTFFIIKQLLVCVWQRNNCGDISVSMWACNKHLPLWDQSCCTIATGEFQCSHLSSNTLYKGLVSDWWLVMDICLWIPWNGDSSETRVLKGALKISEIRFSKISKICF